MDSLKLDKNPNAKVSIETVLSIKDYLLNSDLSIQEIATIHNCKKCIIENIKHGHWAEITGFTGNEKWIRKNSVIKRANRLKDLGVYEKLSIIVEQYDLDNNFINEYKSISEAGELTKTNRTSISLCINNKQQKANNFIWKKKQI